MDTLLQHKREKDLTDVQLLMESTQDNNTSTYYTERLVTPFEAAEELDVCPRRVRSLCKSGRLGQKFGGRWLISYQELAEFARVPRPVGRPKKANA